MKNNLTTIYGISNIHLYVLIEESFQQSILYTRIGITSPYQAGLRSDRLL
jgi:hypothetical protein